MNHHQQHTTHTHSSSSNNLILPDGSVPNNLVATTTNNTTTTASSNVVVVPELAVSTSFDDSSSDNNTTTNDNAALVSMYANSGTGDVEIIRNYDGTPLLDHHNRVVTVRKILATKPLKRDLLTRPGPGNRQLTYMSGECVSRTLNEVFGYDGWCLEIKDKSREECTKDEKGRYHVAYIATVRVIHRKSGAFKEDCGAGDAIDKNLGTAIANALKSAVTDAMKRAARHFGDKLGNSLYEKSFGLNRAPGTLEKALDNYEIDQKVSKFGFEKDRKIKHENNAQNSASAQPLPQPSVNSNGNNNNSNKKNNFTSQSNNPYNSSHTEANTNSVGMTNNAYNKSNQANMTVNCTQHNKAVNMYNKRHSLPASIPVSQHSDSNLQNTAGHLNTVSNNCNNNYANNSIRNNTNTTTTNNNHGLNDQAINGTPSVNMKPLSLNNTNSTNLAQFAASSSQNSTGHQNMIPNNYNNNTNTNNCVNNIQYSSHTTMGTSRVNMNSSSIKTSFSSLAQFAAGATPIQDSTSQPTSMPQQANNKRAGEELSNGGTIKKLHIPIPVKNPYSK